MYRLSKGTPPASFTGYPKAHEIAPPRLSYRYVTCWRSSPTTPSPLGRECSIVGSFARSPNCYPQANTVEPVANMSLAILRSPTSMGVFTRRMPLRFASSTAKPLPRYTGRIPKPAPPPPGPGEVKTPDSNEETPQARRAFKDVVQEDKKKDYKRRYRSTLWKWTGIICGAPILLVTTPYLFKRGEQNCYYCCSNITNLTLLCSFPRRRTKEAR